MQTHDIPALDAEPTANQTQMKAWCPHCEAFHMHGYSDEDMLHKRPHCWVPNSP